MGEKTGDRTFKIFSMFLMGIAAVGAAGHALRTLWKDWRDDHRQARSHSVQPPPPRAEFRDHDYDSDNAYNNEPAARNWTRREERPGHEPVTSYADAARRERADIRHR